MKKKIQNSEMIAHLKKRLQASQDENQRWARETQKLRARIDALLDDLVDRKRYEEIPF